MADLIEGYVSIFIEQWIRDLARLNKRGCLLTGTKALMAGLVATFLLGLAGGLLRQGANPLIVGLFIFVLSVCAIIARLERYFRDAADRPATEEPLPPNRNGDVP